MKVRLKSTLLTALALVACIDTCFADDDYDIVTISVTAPSYDESKPPVIAPVKYNKLCPLVITSDDMGRVEFVRNWAFFNGYPVFSSNYFGQLDSPVTLFNAPYDATTLSWQEPELTATSWQPLTYSDGTGGVRRFTATSAIMPYKIENANYSFINPAMAKAMVRTGWSFAQHDIADQWPSGVSTDEQKQQYIREQLPIQSQKMEEITGYGLKVIVEPNGNKNYMAAGIASDEICWNIYQNATTEYPSQSKLISDWTNTTNGLPTTFTSKPTGAWERFFFQSHENTLKDNYIDTADGTKMILGGTHGMTNTALTILKDISLSGTSTKKDQFWVAGADEVWEYYYLYHNASIQNINYDNGTLTFEVKVPKYKKSQFRELTINIPGITNGTNCTFSDAVVSASSKQNKSQYTINFGLENNIWSHLEELILLYRANLHNEYLKRDCQYLIDLLKPGTKKDGYQAQLDAEAIYSYTVKNSFDETIVTSASDVASEVNYKYPKYILHDGKLHESTKNTNKIQGTNYVANYVGAFTPEGKNQIVNVNYTETAIDNVAFYSEGEDLEGVTVATENFAKIGNNSGIAFALRYASNGGAAEILSPVTATTVAPGKYTLVVAIGDTHTSATASFIFKVGGKTVLSLTTEDVAGYIKEYSKEGIVVKANQPLAIEAENSGGSFWVDYLYLVKTGEYDETVPEVTLTAANTIDVTNGVNPVTITASATGYQDANISQTVIKDAYGNQLATNSGSTCTYEYTPTQVGEIVFTAEATDQEGRTGLSEDFVLTIKSDFTLNAQSNIGDNLASVTLEDRSADEGYTFLYPRYILKGTDLYETSKTGSQMQYGERITFTMANNNVARTINYNKVKPNIVFYAEAEDNALTGTNKNRQTIEYENITQNKGERYALTLGSMGYAASFSSLNITELPAGSYKLYAGIGLTNGTGATFTVKSDNDIVGTLQATSPINLYELSTDKFTIDSNKSITMACSNGNTSNWLDYVYIQKLDAVNVTVGTVGIASFASPYTLDFSNVCDIKAYRGVDETDKVRLYQLTGLIPAGEGLYLTGVQGEVTNNAIPLATTLPDNIGTNDLVGVIEATVVAAGNYVLSVKKDGSCPAFRRLATGTEVPAGRSYLKPNGSQAPQLSIGWDNEGETTGIRTINTDDTETNTIFNLKGMPADGYNPGLVIRNGKIYFNKQN